MNSQAEVQVKGEGVANLRRAGPDGSTGSGLTPRGRVAGRVEERRQLGRVGELDLDHPALDRMRRRSRPPGSP